MNSQSLFASSESLKSGGGVEYSLFLIVIMVKMVIVKVLKTNKFDPARSPIYIVNSQPIVKGKFKKK